MSGAEIAVADYVLNRQRAYLLSRVVQVPVFHTDHSAIERTFKLREVLDGSSGVLPFKK